MEERQDGRGDSVHVQDCYTKVVAIRLAMAHNLREANSDVPTLSQKHSGIPEHLLDKARKQKKDAFDIRTKLVHERQRLPVLPQGIDEKKFGQALDELRKELGSEHVELNDQPFVNGWYVKTLKSPCSVLQSTRRRGLLTWHIRTGTWSVSDPLLLFGTEATNKSRQ